MEELFENFLSKLELTDEDQIFEMNSSKCRPLRMNVPRYIFEKNQEMNVIKVGTDAQVLTKDFSKLMKCYQAWTDIRIPYNLFGHVGNSHLHFNFMPTPEQRPECEKILKKFYSDIETLGGSPFAEHGVGLIKQKFIGTFYSKTHYQIFSLLKKHFDPSKKLFPAGFMSLEPND